MMGKPAARITDMHTCPMFDGPKPHVGGPIIPACCPTVIIGGMPAARVTDKCICVGPIDAIVQGSATVYIGGLPAARIGDMTAHGGIIVTGMPTVLIGDDVGSAGGGGAVPFGFGKYPRNIVQFIKRTVGMDRDRLAGVGDGTVQHPPPLAQSPSTVVKEVNPDDGGHNCGYIIDAAYKRFRGVQPDAVAPTIEDGSFDDIASRYNTTLEPAGNLQEAFDKVQAGGDGTIAVLGMTFYKGAIDENGNKVLDENGNEVFEPDFAHVVLVVNDGGRAAIIEGQGGGEAIYDVAKANAEYNGNGLSRFSSGIVPP